LPYSITVPYGCCVLAYTKVYAFCLLAQNTQIYNLNEIYSIPLPVSPRKDFFYIIHKFSSDGISTLLGWRGLSVPTTLTAKPAVALLPIGPPKPERSRQKEPDEERYQEEGHFDTNSSDDGSSVISNDLSRANDAWDGSRSYSNRRDQSGLNVLYCDVENKWKNYHIITFPG
jgi:hypothetical protein